LSGAEPFSEKDMRKLNKLERVPIQPGPGEL
jgi:hypothetical protein